MYGEDGQQCMLRTPVCDICAKQEELRSCSLCRRCKIRCNMYFEVTTRPYYKTYHGYWCIIICPAEYVEDIWRHITRSVEQSDLMMSRAPHQRLDTEKSRKTPLAIHIYHKVWEPTPYISFRTSPSAIQDLADWRTQRRGAQTLAIINPDARIAAGLPILDTGAEIDHYRITGKSNEYCILSISSENKIIEGLVDPPNY